MARQSEAWHQKSTEPTVRSIRSGLTWLDRQYPLVRRSILPTYLKRKIRQFDLVFRPWTHPLDHSIWHQVRPPMVVGIVKRCEIDPMPSSNCLNLVDPLLSDESSSLRERLEPVFQSKSHAFE